MTSNESFANWAPRVLSIVRIVVALLFLEHGTQKLLGFPAPPSYGMPPMGSLLWFQGVIELVGGILLALGLGTRAIAFILSGDMAVAYFSFHAPKGFYPTLNGGDPASLFCFIFFYLFVAGGGPWSVDAVLRRR